MNTIKVINKKGDIIDVFVTKYDYEIGETITINNRTKCKCKDIINGLYDTTYVFVEGWIEFGF